MAKALDCTEMAEIACLYDFLRSNKFLKQKRGVRFLAAKVPSSQFGVGIGIAVNAAIGTCIISSDVLAFYTSAKLPLAFVFSRGKP